MLVSIFLNNVNTSCTNFQSSSVNLLSSKFSSGFSKMDTITVATSLLVTADFRSHKYSNCWGISRTRLNRHCKEQGMVTHHHLQQIALQSWQLSISVQQLLYIPNLNPISMLYCPHLLNPYLCTLVKIP